MQISTLNLNNLTPVAGNMGVNLTHNSTPKFNGGLSADSVSFGSAAGREKIAVAKADVKTAEELARSFGPKIKLQGVTDEAAIQQEAAEENLRFLNILNDFYPQGVTLGKIEETIRDYNDFGYQEGLIAKEEAHQYIDAANLLSEKYCDSEMSLTQIKDKINQATNLELFHMIESPEAIVAYESLSQSGKFSKDTILAEVEKICNDDINSRLDFKHVVAYEALKDIFNTPGNARRTDISNGAQTPQDILLKDAGKAVYRANALVENDQKAADWASKMIEQLFAAEKPQKIERMSEQDAEALKMNYTIKDALKLAEKNLQLARLQYEP